MVNPSSSEFIIKSQIDNNLTIIGYASVYNISDQQNDIISKGAFSPLEISNVKFLWQHNHLKPIGIINEIIDDTYGLKIDATINSNVLAGKEAIELIMQKAINGLSVGINIIDSNYSNNHQRIISKAELIEISLVTFPANHQATIYQINNSKNHNHMETQNIVKKLNNLEDKINNFFSRPEVGIEHEYEQKNYFQDYLRKGIENNMLTKSLSSHDNQGGVLLLPSLYDKIIKDITMTSPIRQLASIQVISTNVLDLLIEDGKFNCGWVAENENRDDTDNAVLEKKKIMIHELYAQPKATQRLIDDASIDLEGWLIDKLKDSFATAENEAFIKGDGQNKPRGILSYQPHQNENIKINSNNIVDGLLKMINSLKEEYLTNATFLMNRKTLSEIQKLKDDIGRFIWQHSLTDSLVQTIFGIPVKCCEHIPNIEENKPAIILGDFKAAYKIVDRKDIEVLRDPYTSKPFVKFYSVKRVGGDVVNLKALIFGSFNNES